MLLYVLILCIMHTHTHAYIYNYKNLIILFRSYNKQENQLMKIKYRKQHAKIKIFVKKH